MKCKAAPTIVPGVLSKNFAFSIPQLHRHAPSLIHPLNTPPSQRISTLNYLSSNDDLLWNEVALPEAKT